MVDEELSNYDPTAHLSYNTLFFEGGLFFETAENEPDLLEQNRLYRHAMRSYIQAIRVLRRDTAAELNAAQQRYNEVLETSIKSLRKSNEAVIFKAGQNG